jgi:hypothetical protein
MILTTPDPLHRLQVSGFVPGGTPLPPEAVRQGRDVLISRGALTCQDLNPTEHKIPVKDENS